MPKNRRTTRGSRQLQRHISVRSVRREVPDLRKLSKAVIQYAMEAAAAEAEAEAEAKRRQGKRDVN